MMPLALFAANWTRNKQSEHAEELLSLFQRHVLDEPYRLRLRRRYQLFRDELKQCKSGGEGNSTEP